MIKAYHFLKADMRAGEGHEPPWEIGESRTIKKPERISLCEYGYHSSATLWNALECAPGPVACLVEISGPIAWDDTKQVSATRKLIKAVNIECELRLFACDCAERVLYIFERERPADSRPRQAIDIARLFANGNAIKDQLAAARAAASDAARDAARAAASDAAWAAAWAAAWDAAWAAARDAASDAAWAAAWDAAWAAARAARTAEDAAWDAAWAAAWAAEIEWQREHFESMVGGIFD